MAFIIYSNNGSAVAFFLSRLLLVCFKISHFIGIVPVLKTMDRSGGSLGTLRLWLRLEGQAMYPEVSGFFRTLALGVWRMIS